MREGARILITDTRNIRTGREIPSEGYCDQPYVVITRDGNWLCTLTTGQGLEGDIEQHVVSTISTDHGRTWSDLTDIEPPGPPESSWVMPLIVPSGRVYAFYVHNSDNLREVEASVESARRRVDTLGHYAYRYSDDNGRTWSDNRHFIPLRITKIDRDNPYGGKVQFFWGVGKPIVHGNAAYFGFAKVGSFGLPFMESSEGWFIKSTNILTERDPDRIEWELLPDGDVGLRSPDGPVADEHNPVGLSDGSLYCTYRTADGHNGHAYSRDGGHTWTPPEYATFTPGGRRLKHPRAANFVWRCSNGNFLLWYHNHARHDFEGRNPVWICGGGEIDGTIHWSQPEIALYDDDPATRISYPCLVEQDGRYFITETQKTIARAHEIDAALFEAAWAQHSASEVPRTGLVLELDAEACAPGSRVAMPVLEPLSDGGGLTLDLWFTLSDIGPGQVLLDSRAEDGRGIALVTTEEGSIALHMDDGRRRTVCDCDPGVIRRDSLHHLAVIVDGGPKIVTFVLDGLLCDGGQDRIQGWYRFDLGMADVSGSAPLAIAPSIAGSIRSLRLYDRYLLTSEAVGSFRAGPRG